MPSGRLRLLGALLVVLVLGVSHVTTAMWRGAATVPGATLQTGRLDVKLNGADAIADFAPLDVSGLVPGLTRATEVTVSNAGTVPLDYSVVLSGTDGDGKHLFTNLATRVTDGTGDALTCSGTATAGPRKLAPGTSEKLCVQVGLPASASTTLFGSATTVSIVIRSSVRSAWTDDAVAGGTQLAAVNPSALAPSVSCVSGSLRLSWAPVPGATGYVVHSSLLGDQPVLGPDVTSYLLASVLGTVTVRAVYGSSDWVSAPSRGAQVLLGLCSLV